MLRLNILGSVEIYSLTSLRFPNLRGVILNANSVDLTYLSPHPLLRKLVLPPSTDLTNLLDDTEKWPRLTTEFFSNHLDLTMSDTEDEEPSTHEEVSDNMRMATLLLNASVAALVVEFDEREEKLRAERIRRSDFKDVTGMDLDDVKGL